MLEIKGVSLRVPRFALQPISFSVAAGEYFVLFGPTGSGKTMLFEMIAGLRKPDTGEIAINGRDVTRADPAARRIGYVPQDLALIPFKTVRENVAFGLRSKAFRPAESKQDTDKAVRERVAAMLDLLKISHLADRLPAHLSGGEKQRVALGRALVVRPDLLLLDEPLSAVDENTGNALMCEIKTVQRQFGTATLHICHRFEEMLFLADRVALLRDGVLNRLGTPKEICASPRDDFMEALLRGRRKIIEGLPLGMDFAL
jgi:ABC-type sugar transport system ATPase subunit